MARTNITELTHHEYSTNKAGRQIGLLITVSFDLETMNWLNIVRIEFKECGINGGGSTLHDVTHLLNDFMGEEIAVRLDSINWMEVYKEDKAGSTADAEQHQKDMWLKFGVY